MNHQPNPEWESALYGAAGVAHHAELTRLLLERAKAPRRLPRPDQERNVPHPPRAGDHGVLRPTAGGRRRRAERQRQARRVRRRGGIDRRSEEHTSEIQSLAYLVCRLLLEKKKKEKSKY